MTAARDTIFALSSGRPPAAIAVVRLSGPRAGAALEKLVGRVPEPRKAALVRVRDPGSREVIDEALALQSNREPLSALVVNRDRQVYCSPALRRPSINLAIGSGV